MILSGKITDLKMLLALFGDTPIKEIIRFKELKDKPFNKVA